MLVAPGVGCRDKQTSGAGWPAMVNFRLCAIEEGIQHQSEAHTHSHTHLHTHLNACTDMYTPAHLRTHHRGGKRGGRGGAGRIYVLTPLHPAMGMLVTAVILLTDQYRVRSCKYFFFFFPAERAALCLSPAWTV